MIFVMRERDFSGMSSAKVTFEQVEKELRKRNFGILSTVTKEGRSHSAGVVYGVSPLDR